jgi:hypothetical protein
MRAIIEKCLNMFAKEGMQNHIRGLEFNIDTGTVKPICCMHGPHKSRVNMKLVKELESKGTVEDDEGPWGAPIALASGPTQAHIHWSEFTFRLCVARRRINEVTRPFTCPTPDVTKQLTPNVTSLQI